VIGITDLMSKKIITGNSRPHIILNGQAMKWYMIDEFDDKWSNKYAVRAERLASRYRSDEVRSEVMYNHIYRLCELLWKLKVLHL
jgi:hypothetical protein